MYYHSVLRPPPIGFRALAATAAVAFMQFASALDASGAPFAITSPTPGDTIYSGEAFQVKWNIAQQACLTPEYSTDSGVNWTSMLPPDFLGSIGCSSTSWVWNVPADVTPCTHATVQLRGYSDWTLQAVCEPVVIASRSSAARPGPAALPASRNQARFATPASAGHAHDLMGRMVRLWTDGRATVRPAPASGCYLSDRRTPVRGSARGITVNTR